MIDWKQLIEEHSEWEARNFPNVHILECCMGVQEELGELTHHRLKREQGIRGSAREHFAGERDAIGDMTIYLLGVLHHANITAPHVVESVPPENGNKAVLMLAPALAYMHTSVLDPDHNSNVGYAVGLFIDKLEKYCDFMGWSYEVIVKSTWAEVKKRDWVADPVGGVTATPAIQALQEKDEGPVRAAKAMTPFEMEDLADADD